jgi:predicted amidohydrolase
MQIDMELPGHPVKMTDDLPMKTFKAAIPKGLTPLVKSSTLKTVSKVSYVD